jgi:hypothetical protein
MAKDILRIWQLVNGSPERLEFSLNGSDVNFDKGETALSSTNIEDAARELAGLISKLDDEVALQKREISIFFIGNSLTQDVVSYVPLVLKEIAPEINYKLYIWYIGGVLLYNHLATFQSQGTCQDFAVCENTSSWTRLGGKTLDWICENYTFDVVCLQEYYDFIDANSEYVTRDSTYMDIVNLIRSKTEKPFKVVSMLHAPIRKVNESYPGIDTDKGVADQCYRYIIRGMQWQLSNTVCESIIPCGVAIYRAMDVAALDELGTYGHMSPDGVHAQEGLPCLMQAWVVVQWMFDLMGIPKSINNSQTRITSENHTAINVPGANGTVITGTDEQNRLAMSQAITAIKVGKAIEHNVLSSSFLPNIS